MGYGQNKHRERSWK